MGTRSGQILASLVLALCAAAGAAPMWGERREFVQPDSTTVSVLIWGDEYYQRVESLDSATLVRDSAGWICYARISDDSSRYLSTGIVYKGTGTGTAAAGRALDIPSHASISREAAIAVRDSVYRLLNRSRSTPSFPGPGPGDAASRRAGTGSVRYVTGLTIPVDFSDAPATIPRQSIDDLFNKQGYTGYGNNGSVYDYYDDVSSKRLQYTNIVVDYIRAAKPKSYYNSTTVSYGQRAQELVKEVLQALEDQGFDFSTLSADANGNVYAVNVLYAGATPNAWAVGLWPHQGGVYGVTLDGMKIGVYELSNIGASPQIGVLCHENGHMVMGWPDLYDYGGQSQGTGGYDLMSAGTATNPQPPGAWLRDKAGWDEVVDLDEVAPGTVMRHVANSGTSFRYDNPTNAKEHYYVESRRKTGRNRYVPDEGLVVWHVDEAGSNNDEQRTKAKHYKVSLVQADNKFDLESKRSTGDGDLFHAGYKDIFSGATKPNSNWWSGLASNFRLNTIGPVSDTMSFVWAGGNRYPTLPAVKPTKAVSGIAAWYGEGQWSSIPVFTQSNVKMKSTATGLSPTISGGKSTNYAITYDGYFLATQEGAYTFNATSDNAVRVWIDGNIMTDQSSMEPGETSTFSAVLAKGYHNLRVNYMHGSTGIPKLGLTATGPGMTGGAIPSTNLFREATWGYADDPYFLTTSSLGLEYRYYEGAWTKLPNFDSLTPIRTGLTQTVTSNGAGARRASDFGIVFEGYVNVPKLASYTFYLASSDGSRLILDGALLVSNDKLHSLKQVFGSRKLYPGLHSIRVEYFQHSHSPALNLYYATSGVAKRVVPAGMFYNSATQGLAPDEGLLPPDPEEGMIEESQPAADASIRMLGGMLRIVLPEDYQGAAEIDLIDANGRVLSTTPARSDRSANEIYLKHRGSANMVVVRIRMEDRTITKLVPLTF